MESLCFTGTVCSKPSGAKQIEDWVKEITKKVDEDRRKNGQPRYMIMGIDWGLNHKAKRIPVVIGH